MTSPSERFARALLVTALLLATLLFGSVARGESQALSVRCYNKSALRNCVGAKKALRLFRDNPDARALCGTCVRSRRRFDMLVFVDVPPVLKRPVRKAQRR